MLQITYTDTVLDIILRRKVDNETAAMEKDALNMIIIIWDARECPKGLIPRNITNEASHEWGSR